MPATTVVMALGDHRREDVLVVGQREEPVDVRVDVDEAGRDGEPAGVERPPSRERAWPGDRGDLAVLDPQVRHVARLAAAVEDRPPRDHEIEVHLHASSRSSFAGHAGPWEARRTGAWPWCGA
ncbi:hypothetical protein ACSRUE_40705 [Sorangium sp. KYC3313]|uniref:hypothetical protein n=1 Tax=Sorangium sp. KYC3313 TaxID=3449740 RepID=UPI003F8AF3D0